MRWEKLIEYQASLICDIINQAAPPSPRHFVRLRGNTNQITGVVRGDSIRKVNLSF